MSESAVGDWRPIETAPRDGTRVRLQVQFERIFVTQGRWSSRQGCWRYDGDDGPGDNQPTHWRSIHGYGYEVEAAEVRG